MLEKAPPPHPSITVSEQCVTDDLDRLLALLPEPLQASLAAPQRRADLLDVVLDLGRLPAARYPDRSEDLGDQPVSNPRDIKIINHDDDDDHLDVIRVFHSKSPHA